MTDEKEEIAALRREVEALKAAQPKPQKTWAEIERENAEHFDKMHALAEKRMALATPPSALQAMVQHPCNQVMRGVIQDRHAPTGPSMAGTSGQVTGVHLGGGATTGWQELRPLGPQPGIGWVDALAIADEVRQRAELKRKLGGG
jgi:hypothetical protein